MCLLALTQLGFTQDSIITFDRPGIADSPYLTPNGTIQLELGTSYTAFTGITESYLPAVLLRIPIKNKTEIRFALNYEPQSLKYILYNFTSDFDPIAIGFKRKIKKEYKRSPEIAFSANAFYPIQGLNNINIHHVNADFYFLFHDNIGKRSGLNYNIGYIYANSHLKNVLAWSFCYNHKITDKTTAFAEYFGYYHFLNKKLETGFDAGLVYEFGKTFQLDISYIFNDYKEQSLGFLALGISYNLNYQKKDCIKIKSPA